MTYRIGFALTTALGNRTRYVNLRKYVDRDPEVKAIWAPITHYLDPDPYHRRPRSLHDQRVLNHQAGDILANWHHLDAVVVHAFQLYSYLSLRPRRHGRPLLALYQDYAPFRDPTVLQDYGQEVQDDLRRRVRFRLQAWFAKRADLCFPWSDWAARSFIDDCGVAPARVHVINPGVDLELWKPTTAEPHGGRLRLLFVGGDFERKGGRLLLDAMDDLGDVAELDIVTREPPRTLPPRVRVHTGVHPNDGTLRELFRLSDALVHPAYAEMAGLVLLEAMATARPVVATAVGGIPDLVDDGVTGILVPPGSPSAVVDAVHMLAQDPGLRAQMGRAGRARVEAQFNAGLNAARMLVLVKAAVSQQPHRESVQAPGRSTGREDGDPPFRSLQPGSNAADVHGVEGSGRSSLVDTD